ncbi:MAG: pyridoxal phosphate-dependent aminotransferase [Pseudomonadota bacterium]
MHASTRLQTLTDDPSGGWEIFERARAMIRDGTPVIELTIGEHDIRTDPRILEAMDKAARAGHTGYAAVPGTATLREAIASRVAKRTGVPTTPSNVLITPGGQSALFAAHIAAGEPGDRAAYLDPYYATYPGTIRAAGLIPTALQTAAQHGFLPQKTDLLADTKGCCSLLVNTPNNPTGGVYPRTTAQDILDVAKTNDLWIISDEVYDTQDWTQEFVSLRSLEGAAERTLTIGSMSKSHAMTGSRIGWIIGPDPVIQGLITLATHTTYGVPGFIQDAALHALSLGPKFEAEIAAPFLRRRNAVLELLEGQNIVKAQPSGGAMYLMLDIRATGLSGKDFADQLLDEAHIAVMPGESFGQAAAGHIRLALTQPDSILIEAVKALLRFASQGRY